MSANARSQQAALQRTPTFDTSQIADHQELSDMATSGIFFSILVTVEVDDLRSLGRPRAPKPGVASEQRDSVSELRFGGF